MSSPAGSFTPPPAGGLDNPKGVVPQNPKYFKVMEMQKYFTTDNGKFVWQKMPKDKLLYGSSILLCVSGALVTALTLKQMYWPGKK